LRAGLKSGRQDLYNGAAEIIETWIGIARTLRILLW
jgi:hypothetical protein